MAWLTGWSRRMPDVVDNTANAAGLRYFHHAITITGARYTSLHATAKADRSDLRVTDSDGTTLLNFVLDDTSIASEVRLVVKVPTLAGAASRTIYIYYGKADASSVSSGPNTFVSTNKSPALGGSRETIYASAGVSRFVAAANCGSGRIVAAYSRDCGANGEDGKLRKLISTDSGDSWADTLLIDPGAGSGVTIGTPRITKLTGGTWSGRLLCAIQIGTNAEMGTATGANKIIYSDDNGDTFAQGSTITKPSGFDRTIPCSGILEISAGGDLWWPWYGKITGDDFDSVYLMVCTSGNDPEDGANWALKGGSIANATVMRDTTQTRGWNECDITKTGSTIIIVARSQTVEDSDTGTQLGITKTTDTGATWSTCAGAITGATNATPIVVTSTAHGLANGSWVFIAGVGGNTAANGHRQVANIAANTFELVGSVGNGAYTSGGAWAITQATVSGQTSGFGVTPVLLTNADGDVILQHAERGATSEAIVSTVSTDAGATWYQYGPFALSVEAAAGDVSYFSACVRDDGLLLNIWPDCESLVTGPGGIYSAKCDLDAIVNFNGFYQDFEDGAFGAAWAVVGAQLTITTDRPHSGTKSAKFNAAAGTDAKGQRTCWDSSATNLVWHQRNVAYSSWYNLDQLAANWWMIATDTSQFCVALLVTAGLHIQEYEGGGDFSNLPTDTTVALDAWFKITVQAEVKKTAGANPSPTTGRCFVNNVNKGAIGGVYSQANNYSVEQLIGDRNEVTQNTTGYLSPMYGHQWVANVPTSTVGAEESLQSTGARRLEIRIGQTAMIRGF